MNDHNIPFDNDLEEGQANDLHGFDVGEPDDACPTEDEAPVEDLFPADDEYYDGTDGEYYDEADDEPLSEGDYTEVPRPKRKKKRSLTVRLLLLAGKGLLALVLIAAILGGGLIGYLTVTEYYPAHAETAQRGAVSVSQKLSTHSLRLLTFNTGYGGLGEDADFFMDGGSGVNPEDEKTVTYNMMGIECILEDADADVLLLHQ